MAMQPGVRILFCVLSLAFFGMLAQSAFACTCMRDGTVDDAFESYPFVAILKLEAVGGTYKADPSGSRFPGRGQSRLAVSRTFKGALSVGERVVFRQLPSPMCGWSFRKEDIGKEFLFYFNSGQEPGKKIVKPAVWSGSICSRSGSLNRKLADIPYLENYEKVRGRTRISGMVLKVQSASEAGVSGHRLIVEGNGKKVEITTGRNGVYELYDLPAGSYKITVGALGGYGLAGGGDWSEEFELETGGHFEKVFSFESER